MKFFKVIDEGFEFGPAVNIDSLAKEVLSRKNRSRAIQWAQNEIKSLVGRIGSGSGRTVHMKGNDLSKMFSALDLYIDDKTDAKTKEYAKKEYEKTLQKMRASK